MGWVWLAVGVAVVVMLAIRGAPIFWYAMTVIPFFLAALGFFQAREQTCVFFAAVGQRDLDGGAERIDDRDELSRVRSQASKVWVLTVIATVGLVTLTLLIAAFVT
jgi:hypothetical protein